MRTCTHIPLGPIGVWDNNARFMAAVVSPVGMWMILCDFCVVGWNLSPVLLQMEVAPVSNIAELLSPRIDVTYECDDCSCDKSSSFNWLVSVVQ